MLLRHNNGWSVDQNLNNINRENQKFMTFQKNFRLIYAFPKDHVNIVHMIQTTKKPVMRIR